MPNQFNIGDVVQLKSGGPKMTVTRINEEQHITTAWFAGSKKESGVFPVEAILIVTEQKK